MGMHNEMWFPTVIWSSILNGIDNRSLKNYAYEVKKGRPNAGIVNYNGYSSDTLDLGENYNLDKLIDTVTQEVEICRKQVQVCELELFDFWLNINPPGSYLKSRIHPAATFVGLYFIDGAKKGGNLQFERTDRGEYHIPTKIEQNNYYNATHAQYAGKESALYVWPGWLSYQVDGNLGNTDQLSISFVFGEKL